MCDFVEMIKKISWNTFIVSCTILSVSVSSALAGLPLNIRGNMDVSYGETNINSNNQELFQQKYSFNWSKSLLSQLILRSSYNYNKTNLTRNSSNPIWQEQQLPSADLIWNNSIFTLSASNNYRTTNATITNLQISTKSLSLYLKTKSIHYPIISFRFNKDHNYNHTDLSLQNLFENRYQAEINYSFNKSMVHYGFTRRYNENRINNLKETQYLHVLRLNDVRKFSDNKLTLSSNYSMTYQKETDERRTDTTDFFVLEVQSGLYAQTNNYTLDSLQHVRALTDGNLQDVIIPIIDFGGTEINQNIGVDFGYEQNVNAIYIYVDQYSDKNMWQLYTSSDNMNWELNSSILNSIFNNGYNRFEIKFPTIKTRYIKVVNLDISDIEHAYVTEIQALEEREMSNFTESNSTTHYVDINTNYNYSEKISSMANLSYQHLPGQFGSKKRDNISYAISTRIKQTEKIIHNFRWQQNKQLFHGTALDVSDFGISYLMNYLPLERLTFSFSSQMRLDYIDGVKNTKNTSFLLNSRGTPLNNLQVTLEFTYSRNNQYLSDVLFDSWNQKISFEGAATRSLSVISSYSHRYTKFKQFSTDSISTTDNNRDLYLVGIRYRFTKTIFIRSSFNLNQSNSSYFSQDYMLSWNPSSKLTINSQMRLQNDNDIKITKRYNTQLSYKIGRNANIYLSYLITDLTQANGDRNKSIRAGFRSGL